MDKTIFRSYIFWNSFLFISVLFSVFILPLLTVTWHQGLFRIVYSCIYFAAFFTLQKRSKYLITLFVVTLILEWISNFFDLTALILISKSVNVLFFLVIVGSMIKQIATAHHVTANVILGSITGYLLLGMIFSIFISVILTSDPTAYNINFSDASLSEERIKISIPMYYGFITMTTVGYGDILPLKPYTRSLATFIAVTGQFYIAIIVALLVGKFTSQDHFSPNPENKE